jgi:hypothetical protein
MNKSGLLLNTKLAILQLYYGENMLHEMFKDIKGAIRNRKSKERQYTGHQKKTIHWPSEKDNTLAIRKRQYTGHQKKTIQLAIRKRQYTGHQKKTIHWPSEKDKKYTGASDW